LDSVSTAITGAWARVATVSLSCSGLVISLGFVILEFFTEAIIHVYVFR